MGMRLAHYVSLQPDNEENRSGGRGWGVGLAWQS